jgi:hypothetical protein
MICLNLVINILQIFSFFAYPNHTFIKMQKNRISGVVVFLSFVHFSFAQNNDSTKSISHFSGSAGITQNGISLVPTFSLGEPAGVVMLSMGKKKFSFDPEFRFSLKGKPWSVLFWFRYQAVKTNKFSLRIGAHPALNFVTRQVSINGALQDAIVTRRFFAAELSPNYFITKNISIGTYYLYARGFDKGTAVNTHFLTLNANFSYLKLTDDYFMKFSPQVFLLKQDKLTGYFTTATVTFARKNFPISIAALFNKQLKAGINGAKDFVWNATLIYSFGKNYIEK